MKEKLIILFYAVVFVGITAFTSIFLSKSCEQVVEEKTEFEITPQEVCSECCGELCWEILNKIYEIRQELGDKDFKLKDAKYILTKIKYWCDYYNLSLKDGLIIVNVESDFKKDATNSLARGLTQITKDCLTEYNNYSKEKYTFDDMLDPDINLKVGFWYYDRILNHYSTFEEYGITTSTPEKALRDSYIAYNIGITKFKDLGRSGRNALRNGIYPERMYGFAKGSKYSPVKRYYRILDYWSLEEEANA